MTKDIETLSYPQIKQYGRRAALSYLTYTRSLDQTLFWGGIYGQLTEATIGEINRLGAKVCRDQIFTYIRTR